MTEAERPAESRPAASAGALLREARQAQGLHIAVLAASIKVSQRKLEALEADRFDELPDATFTRALAQTVCRSLKIDPAPVLALLPQHQVDDRLAHVSQGINARFRDAPGRAESSDLSAFSSPAVWGPALLIVGAVIVYFWPQGWMPELGANDAAPVAAASAPEAGIVIAPIELPAVEPVPAPTPAPEAVAAAPELAAPAASAPPVVEAAPPAPAPVPVAADAPAPVVVDAAADALIVRANATSWVEVVDASSTVLVSRLLKAGESLALDGAPPLKVRVGNAAETELVFRGQPVDLAPSTRDNVARLELK